MVLNTRWKRDARKVKIKCGEEEIFRTWGKNGEFDNFSTLKFRPPSSTVHYNIQGMADYMRHGCKPKLLYFPLYWIYCFAGKLEYFTICVLFDKAFSLDDNGACIWAVERDFSRCRKRQIGPIPAIQTSVKKIHP